MHALITGAHGFIGSELTRRLLGDGLPLPEGGARPLRRLTLVDRQPAPPDLLADPRVHNVVGDASDAALLATLVGPDLDVVFTLGATLTSEAERDFDLGMDINLHGMLRLLDVCRHQARCPRVVVPSSIAVFGGPLPESVGDDQALTPQTSYGTQKAMVELLVNDCSRRGHVDGRVLRLPIVVVRPQARGRSISDRIGALVREPLLGRDVECPLDGDTRLPVGSVQAAADALRSVAGLPADAFGATRAMNLPSLSVRVHELVQIVQTLPAWRGWRHPVGQVLWEPDPAMQDIVGAWPKRIDSERARRLGVVGDRSLPHLINRYINAHIDRQQAAA